MTYNAKGDRKSDPDTQYQTPFQNRLAIIGMSGFAVLIFLLALVYIE